jgi:hypothetical protein
VAGGFGAINPGVATGCGVPAAPIGGFFKFNNSWIWIVILLIFVLPRLGLCGVSGIGGLFGGMGWIWILILVIFLVPGILPGFRLGKFAI